MPGLLKIDALSNICNLCEYVFHKDWSAIAEFTCDMCKKNKFVGKTIPLINLDTIASSFQKSGEALQTSGFSERRCCNQSFSSVVTYGPQTFIECDNGSTNAVSLEQFPNSIELDRTKYILAGFVMYVGERTARSVGHYTAFVNKGTEWVEFDDLEAQIVMSAKRCSKKKPAPMYLCKDVGNCWRIIVFGGKVIYQQSYKYE